MAHVNMQEGGGDSAGRAGIYPIRVKAAREKTGKKPPYTPYFSLELVNDETGEPLCYTNIMLMGKGWNLGKLALRALGVRLDFEGDLLADELVGRRAYAALKVGSWEGQERLEVDVKMGKGGWWPWGEKPDGVADSTVGAPPPSENDLSTPF